ncbi:MAG: FkbM family methyltransferase [Archaeoglobaceae archaeon]
MTTIDKFVEETNIEKVDFIKIDTEGYEREIIKGAKETIRKFKPKMAISAYHLPDDKEKIPELILSIRDDYRFKLVNKGDEDLFFF